MKIQTSNLKICGITRSEDLDVCCRLGVSYVGFNFFPGSKRHISVTAAAAMWRNRPVAAVRTKPCAVVVDIGMPGLTKLISAFPELSVIQFHGREQLGDVELAREQFRQCQIWCALQISSAEDLAAAGRWTHVTDLILFDAKDPKSPGELGGTGTRFDWKLLDGYKSTKPYGVAGGVLAADVKLLRERGVGLIDICSGVEVSPGVKDPALLEEVVTAWRGWSAS